MSRSGEVVSFNVALRRCETIADSTALFSAQIAPHGFDGFACGEIDLARRELMAFFAVAWPEAWLRFYVAHVRDRDPVVDALRSRREPYTWSDLQADRHASRETRDLFAAARAHGWTEGLAIPIPRGSIDRFGLVSLAGHGPPLESAERDSLALMGLCFFDHVRSLVPRCGFATAPAGLTRREMDCVRLVARGHSDRAIGAALGISQTTAHEYVESARRKLAAATRAEMVGVATSLAIVQP